MRRAVRRRSKKCCTCPYGHMCYVEYVYYQLNCHQKIINSRMPSSWNISDGIWKKHRSIHSWNNRELNSLFIFCIWPNCTYEIKSWFQKCDSLSHKTSSSFAITWQACGLSPPLMIFHCIILTMHSFSARFRAARAYLQTLLGVLKQCVRKRRREIASHVNLKRLPFLFFAADVLLSILSRLWCTYVPVQYVVSQL